jgi:hypothetical protein
VKQSQSWLEDLRAASSQPWLLEESKAAKTPEYWLEEKVLLDQKTPSRHTQPWVREEEVRKDARRFYPGFSYSCKQSQVCYTKKKKLSSELCSLEVY